MHLAPLPTAVVADDERLMRDQIVGRLKDAWPELRIVGEAANGSEAVALVQSLEPDIVFLDISMPGMDGIQAARALAGTVHVVFVTAHDEHAITAFEQGAVDYVLKPAEPTRLAVTCERLRERLQRAPDPMNDLLATLSSRLGPAGVKPREYLRWVQASALTRLPAITRAGSCPAISAGSGVLPAMGADSTMVSSPSSAGAINSLTRAWIAENFDFGIAAWTWAFQSDRKATMRSAGRGLLI